MSKKAKKLLKSIRHPLTVHTVAKALGKTYCENNNVKARRLLKRLGVLRNASPRSKRPYYLVFPGELEKALLASKGHKR